MAYWVVNTIRHQLKEKSITSDWRELVRVMNTQKCVTTCMNNDKGERLSVRCCSKPTPKVATLYDALKLKPAPSTIIKSDAKSITIQRILLPVFSSNRQHQAQCAIFSRFM